MPLEHLQPLRRESETRPIGSTYQGCRYETAFVRKSRQVTLVPRIRRGHLDSS